MNNDKPCPLVVIQLGGHVSYPPEIGQREVCNRTQPLHVTFVARWTQKKVEGTQIVVLIAILSDEGGIVQADGETILLPSCGFVSERDGRDALFGVMADRFLQIALPHLGAGYSVAGTISSQQIVIFFPKKSFQSGNLARGSCEEYFFSLLKKNFCQTEGIFCPCLHIFAASERGNPLQNFCVT